MDYFAGLDVSLETVSICIVNAAGDILLEKKIEAEPAAIIALLKHFGRRLSGLGSKPGQPHHGCTENCAASAIRQSASSAAM